MHSTVGLRASETERIGLIIENRVFGVSGWPSEVDSQLKIAKNSGNWGLIDTHIVNQSMRELLRPKDSD